MHEVIVVQLILQKQNVGIIAYANGWKAYTPLQLRLQPDFTRVLRLQLASGQ